MVLHNKNDLTNVLNSSSPVLLLVLSESPGVAPDVTVVATPEKINKKGTLSIAVVVNTWSNVASYIQQKKTTPSRLVPRLQLGI